VSRLATALLLAAVAPLPALALCTSDDVPPVATLVERFTRADCPACWREPAGPRPSADTLVLDWVVPGREAAAGALAPSDDALDRLAALGQRPPAKTAVVTRRREGAAVPLRIAHGEAVNDYVGTSIELGPAGSEPWQAWLLLVEKVPAGVGGSPGPRIVVRKVFRPDWQRPGRGAGPLAETRSMQMPPGTRPERLRLVGLLQDGRGRIRAITQTECSN
jgi:hypothetical protein